MQIISEFLFWVKSGNWKNNIKHYCLLQVLQLNHFLWQQYLVTSFVKSIDPNIVFLDYSMNIVYVGLSTGTIIVMGTIFCYYIIGMKTFDNIFANMMKSDYIITRMYFSMVFLLLAPATMSTIILIWLFGIWILGMLLTPFNKEKTILKK